MAPPPNPGNASNKNDDDPLGGMDPMAWLESLAARQGANPDELVTAANLDIPVPPADTVVDEPGYTPGYESSKPAAKAPEPAKVEPPPPPEPEPVAASMEDPLGGMDPMAWLESLAARQGANPDELVTAANLDIPVPPADTVVDEPGYTPGYESSKPIVKAPEPEPYQPIQVSPPPPPEPEPVAASMEDPLGGMDPMAWLESLAARQGANPDELVTAANLDIPVPPADSVIDEPGYVDFDAVSGKTAPMEPLAVPEPEPFKANLPPEPEPIASVSPGAPADDPLHGMDPLAWLEALAARQGANKEELITGGTAQVPEEPTIEEAMASGPGYSDYSPFSEKDDIKAEPIMSADEAAALLGLDNMPQPSVPVGSKLPVEQDDPLAFLHNLAATQEPAGTASPTDYRQVPSVPESSTMGAESALSWLEELARGGETQPMAPLTFDTPATPTPIEPEPVSETGGMSDNLDEVQAWLNAQAQSLALTRDALDAADQQGELPPAEAAELPDWLRESMPQIPIAPVQPALTDEIIVPVNPDELPPWLAEPEQGVSADLEQDLLAAMQSITGPGQPAPAGAMPPQTAEPIPADVGSLTQPESPEAIDQWAVALDEEYERRQAGDESVPDWYLEALRRADEVVPVRDTQIITPESEVVPGPPEPVIEMPTTEGLPPAQEEAPVLPQTGPLEMPSWLTAEMEEPAPIEQGEIPDWLKSMAPAAEAQPAMPAEAKTDWLSGIDAGDLPEIPDWLEQTSPKRPDGLPTSPPVVTPAAPPPTPVEPVTPAEPLAAAQKGTGQLRPTAPLPARPAAEPVRPPVSPAAVGDHAARLKQARDLVANNRHQESLEHYQALIDASAHLEETRGDLRTLAEKEPKNPRVRRLLGDTHMRLGDLQAALDTYRSALDQL